MAFNLSELCQNPTHPTHPTHPTLGTDSLKTRRPSRSFSSQSGSCTELRSEWYPMLWTELDGHGDLVVTNSTAAL